MNGDGASRRAVITRSAVGLAVATAGALIADGASSGTAEAATGSGITDWINVVTQYMADPEGASDSTSAIQAALTAASPGQVVYLPAGTYKTTGPLIIPPFVTLRGSRGAVAAADLEPGGGNFGTVIKPANNWALPQPAPNGVTLTVKGVITLLDCQAGGYPSPPSPNTGVNAGIHIRDIIIDGSESPTGIDGIAAFGAVQAVRIDSVGIYRVTGNGISGKKNGSSTAADHSPDGWHVNNVIIQSAEGNGWGGPAGSGGDGLSQDSTLIDVHVQACQGDGFWIISNNCTLIGCRSDYSGGNGYTVDVFNQSGIGSVIKLISCNTDSSQKNGLNVINSSPSGTVSREPVLAVGCNFHADGVNGGIGGGGYAGINVTGRSTLLASGTIVTADTNNVPGAGCPQYALATAASGTAPGEPVYVGFSGGLLNSASATVVKDAAPAAQLQIDPQTATLAGIFTTTLRPYGP